MKNKVVAEYQAALTNRPMSQTAKMKHNGEKITAQFHEQS